MNTTLKQQFPIFQTYPDLVYLDNAATSQKPQEVIEAEINFYKRLNANVHRGIYKLSEDATQAYEESRESIAKLIKVQPEEIVLTSGTTDSINKLALALEIEVSKDDRILVTPSEHHSNLLPWQQLARRRQAHLEYVNLDNDLGVDLTDLEAKLKEGAVRIVALSHVSNVTGVINPISKIAELVHKYSALLCVDGAQAMGHMDVDMTKLGADFYSFSGHKMYGPTGIGVLWGKAELLKRIPPLSFGGGMIEFVERESSTYAEIPGKHEAGTPNIAGALGLKAAAEFTDSHMTEILESKQLGKYALYQLQTISQLHIVGPMDISKRGDVISFTIDGVHPHDLAQNLDSYNIAVRAGHHCCQILHREILHAPATLRASFAIYNNESDIDKLVQALKDTITRFQL